MSPPKVSIIVATRNRPALLRECLNGINRQSFRDFEVVIIDDASQDDAIQQCRQYLPEFGDNFRLHEVVDPNDRAGNPAAARNRGMSLATGDLFAFCDDDDVWTCSSHLQNAVDAMSQHGADYYFADMRSKRDGQVVDEHWFRGFEPGLMKSPLSNGLYLVDIRSFAAVMRHCLIHPNMSVIDRRLVEKVDGFCERVVFSEDYEFMMRLADKSTKIIFRDECIADYRLPGADAHSTRVSPIAQILDRITATGNIRIIADHPAIRWSARAREAWAMRELSEVLRKDGKGKAAFSYAWQGLCTFPTPGAALNLLSILPKSFA